MACLTAKKSIGREQVQSTDRIQEWYCFLTPVLRRLQQREELAQLDSIQQARDSRC